MEPNNLSLGFYPTPCVPLMRLSKELGGPQIWMKRDDQTGLALGGNKTRKLEHLLHDALASNADTVITAGAQQSNHCRQTAAACAAVGLKCHLLLGGVEPASFNGNLLLDHLFGATIHFTGAERKGERIARIAEDLEKAGSRPYVIPYGGSNPIGASAFVHAAREVKSQLDELGLSIDRIIFPSSSGGTQAGLIAGARMHGLQSEIIGVAIDKEEAGDEPFAHHILAMANGTNRLFNKSDAFTLRDVVLRDEYTGGGYGVVGRLEREAISLTASLEGILLDPVYTGRAMGALIDIIRRGEIAKSEVVLFWHTGGTPALFPYASELVDSDSEFLGQRKGPRA